MVLPVGGADMPVIVSLLNSLSGLATSASGFMMSNSMVTSLLPVVEYSNDVSVGDDWCVGDQQRSLAE